MRVWTMVQIEKPMADVAASEQQVTSKMLPDAHTFLITHV